MAQDKEDERENQDKVKYCPFLDKYCIKERCALYVVLTMKAGLQQQKLGACGFNAVIQILSEINQKTQVPQQSFKIPNLRGS